MAAQRSHVKRTGAGMVSISEAARMLGISRTQVRRYIEERYLDYGVYPGGRRMVTVQSLHQFERLALEGRL